MQLLKKISTLFLIWFMIVTIGSAKQIENRNLETYTFSYYSNFLDKTLIPEIKKYIEAFELIPYSSEKGNSLIQGVLQIIEAHLISNNMLVHPNQQYPVTLAVIPPDENNVIIYYVNIVLPLIEYDEEGKINSVLMISKNFFCGKELVSKKTDI